MKITPTMPGNRPTATTAGSSQPRKTTATTTTTLSADDITQAGLQSAQQTLNDQQESDIDSDKVAEKIADEARDDTPQALDAVWEEEQVKFFADKGCGDSAITAHQRRFAGAVAPQYLNITTGGQH